MRIIDEDWDLRILFGRVFILGRILGTPSPHGSKGPAYQCCLHYQSNEGTPGVIIYKKYSPGQKGTKESYK
jgi:hypothetical protein